MEAPLRHSTVSVRLCTDVLEAIACSRTDNVEVIKIMAAKAIYGSVASLAGCHDRLDGLMLDSKVSQGAAGNARRLIVSNGMLGLPDIFPTGDRNKVTLVWERFHSRRHTQVILLVDSLSFEMIRTIDGRLSTHRQQVTYSGGAFDGEIASALEN